MERQVWEGRGKCGRVQAGVGEPGSGRCLYEGGYLRVCEGLGGLVRAGTRYRPDGWRVAC